MKNTLSSILKKIKLTPYSKFEILSAIVVAELIEKKEIFALLCVNINKA